MTAQLTSAIVRIFKAKGEVVGAGFLVSEKHILSCAHVVNAAMGRHLTTPDEPTGEICLDFPRVAPLKTLRARVVCWIPVHPSTSTELEEGTDIAVLELESAPPNEARPVRLVTAEELWGHRFQLFGFPEKHENGVWTHGELRQPITGGRVQIEVVQETAFRVESGFSGAPVWDEQLDGVAGMTVTAEKQRSDVKAAFIIPTAQLVKAWTLLKEQAIPPCPYRNLLPFLEEDEQFFFGRGTFTEKLVEAVKNQSLVAVVGASGSGKSSAVFAGLIPRLRCEATWHIVHFQPGDRPLHTLAVALIPLLEPQSSPIDRIGKTRQLEADFRQAESGLRDAIEAIIWSDPGSRLLLVVDQFEELYTLCQNAQERQCFLDRLLEAVNLALKFNVVITLRADFFGYALSYRPLADALQYADLKLGPMNRQELQAAIEKPAYKCGVQLEPGLTERILDAVSQEPGNLPLLEFALTLLWEKQKGRRLTHAAYEEIGGVEKALATHAQQKYEELKNSKKLEVAKRIFLELTQLGDSTEDTRRRVQKNDLITSLESEVLVNEVVGHLTAAKLIVTSALEKGDERVAVVDVAHEALIRHWPLLRQWLEENRENLRKARNIEASAQEWQSRGKPRDLAYLLQGQKLTEAENLLQINSIVHLTSLAQNFIKASQKVRRLAQVKTGAAIIVPVAAIAISSVLIWQRSIEQKLQQLREAALLGIPRRELIPVLADALQKADSDKNLANSSSNPKDVEQALNSYQTLSIATGKFRIEIAKKPKEFQPLDSQKVQQIAKQADISLVELIQKYRLPQLEEELRNGKWGKLKEPTLITDLENQYEPGALRTTYAILMGKFGAKADWNDDGELTIPEEAEQMPCETLKAIEKLWRQYTKNRCGWYESKSYDQAPGCRELNGLTLTEKIFVKPFDLATNRLNYCQVSLRTTNQNR